MIKDAINSVFADVAERANSIWTGMWAPISEAWPLWWSYGVFGLIVLACLFLAVFLQFKWVRAGLLAVIVGAGAWLLGSVMMYRTMKEKIDAERKKRRR